MRDAPHHPLDFTRQPPPQMQRRAAELLAAMTRRRSVRAFSTEPIPLDVVRRCIHLAAQAPSGANKQPWSFALVTDPTLKRQIREAAEAEERAFYGGRAPQSWLDDLAPLATDADKPFLEDAPALIVPFAHIRGDDGAKHYYVRESIGLACGMLLMALHLCGLATLTHTPSPMGFLTDVLGRPAHHKPYLLIPVGYPTPDCTVPTITRKPLAEVLDER